MSKRLTDSTKWRHPWFRRLPGKHKLAFIALLDLCDCAGVWRVDLDDLAYLMREDGLEWDDFLTHMEGRIILLDDGAKWQVRDYIAFQYGTLNPTGKNRVHISVIKCLRIHGIDPTPYFSPTLGSTVDATVGPTVDPTVKEKEKEKVSSFAVLEGESERKVHPDEDVFSTAPRAVSSGRVNLGPHEIKAPLISAGAKFYGKEDAPGWLGVVNRCGGLDRVIHFMERMPAEERADRVKVEAFIQKTASASQKALKLNRSGDASRSAEADRKAQEATIRAANEASRGPLTRISDYLCDPETPEDLRKRAADDPTVANALINLRVGKVSALSLGSILKKFDELRAVAYPDGVRIS